MGSVWLAVAVAAVSAIRPVPVPAAAWDDVVTRYASVKDYTCRYVKEERAIDHGEPQTIRLSFRKPFDVRMEWLDDHGDVDQVAVYRRGMNDSKVIARRRGLLGSMVGTVHLDPRDRRALEDSRHPITEVGFWPLIDGIAQGLRDWTLHLAAVDDGPDGRRFAFEVAPAASPLDVSGARRILILIGAETSMPVSVEIVDPSGARLERHRFSDIHLNVGLGDAVFTL
jgi:outer membrane lipoprotein-sorting protein